MVWFYVWIFVQIIAESFPISSSSHVALLEKILAGYGFADFFIKVPDHFDDVIHGPTLIVLAFVFWQRWTGLVHMMFYNWQRVLCTLGKTACGALITVFFYFLFEFTTESWFPLPLGLGITTFLLWSLRWANQSHFGSYTLWKAGILGLVQGLTLLPGLSRLGTTYCVARWLKLSSRHAMEISFALQVPLIIPAVARGLICAYKSPFGHEVLNGKTLFVMLIASIFTYKALLWTLELAHKNSLWKWSIYMILPCILSILV